MNSKKVELIEIELTLNTGFNMFLNPNKVVLRFNREIRDTKPKNKTVLGRETTHKDSVSKSAKSKKSKI